MSDEDEDIPYFKPIKNDTDDDEDTGYEDVQIEKDIDDAHSFIDRYKPKNVIEDDQNQIAGEDNGGDELQSDAYKLEDGDTWQEDQVETPESFEIAAHKYNIEPDIAPDQQHDFSPNRAFYGRHVVNSNTRRSDNFRVLMFLDAVNDYDAMPSHRQRGNQIRQLVTSELQLSRGNPEVGGFDRKLQRSVIKREDVDLKQTQTMNGPSRKRKSMLGSVFGRKNKGG